MGLLSFVDVGLQADVFRVVPWKGVYVAAPACDPIVLPTTEAAWNSFIENTAHHLKNLLVRTKNRGLLNGMSIA